MAEETEPPPAAESDAQRGWHAAEDTFAEPKSAVGVIAAELQVWKRQVVGWFHCHCTELTQVRFAVVIEAWVGRVWEVLRADSAAW